MKKNAHNTKKRRNPMQIGGVLQEKKIKEAQRRWKELKELSFWKEKPYSELTIRGLAEELLEWAKNDEHALVIDEFRAIRNIGESTWYRVRKQYEFFEDAYQNAKTLIGIRREKGAMVGKLSDSAVNRTQPAYSKRLRRTEEWRSSLRQKESERGAGTIVVRMDQYPDSADVPLKPEGTD